MSDAKHWYFRFDATAWITSTLTMTATERGIHISLLAWSWVDGAIPDRNRDLVSIAGAKASEVRDVLADRWTLTAEGWRNGRLEVERAWAMGRTSAARNAASMRWQSESNADALLTQCESDAIQSQSQNQSQSKKRNTPRRASAPEGALSWTGEWVGLTDEDLHAWNIAYPAVTVWGELERMSAWLTANPSRKKRDYRRFIVGWLGRTQTGSTIARVARPLESNF